MIPFFQKECNQICKRILLKYKFSILKLCYHDFLIHTFDVVISRRGFGSEPDLNRSVRPLLRLGALFVSPERTYVEFITNSGVKILPSDIYILFFFIPALFIIIIFTPNVLQLTYIIAKINSVNYC